MLRGIGNFAKRHRKKLLFSAACAGGAYCAWKFWLPRLQQQMLERLLKDSGGDLKELLEIAARGDDPEREQRDKRASFVHKQEVSDAHARKALEALQARHKDLFSVEGLFEKVKTAPSKEAKLEAFAELQVECFARLVSALYALHSLVLLHRVEFNIAGREIAGGKPAEEDSDMLAAFLESTRFFKEEGVGRIAPTVREAVRKHFSEAKMVPSVPVTVEALEGMFTGALGEAHGQLLGESHSVATLLPESVDQEVPEEYRPKVKPLLDETRDYLESPQFAEVLKLVLAKAAKHIANSLGDGADDLEAAPMSGGRSCPLAKLSGHFVELSKTVLDSEGNTCITRFSEEPVITELCEALYFQDGAKGQ